ncbi:GIY-YIG catalytic domain-containing protein [Ureibacillus xyleni]|uniref:GIY-YIG catalytic domain-containing protein n=1 Tax=Ureibacillus xyleni TaxID=614648 RepID=A0A285R9H3_9BACL|nr:GIY-YIG nuclease family protein [Ureibacillus xyleni]SOB90408.1 GIY-YIG catalytic domain-containing protein [Ureibacillus xyleni]
MYKNHIKFITNDELPNTSGIYLLYDEKSDLAYIGSASNLRNRIANHRSNLIHQKHPNDMLQAMFNMGCLCVRILVTFPFLDKKRLKEAENLFIEASPAIFKNPLVNRYKSVPFHQSFVKLMDEDEWNDNNHIAG